MNLMNWLINLLGGDRYRPSTVALNSDPVMKILFVSGWGAVFAACVAISLSLFLSRAPRITVSGRAITLYAAFILLLGLDHLMSATTIFLPVYRLKGVVLAAAAAVSLTRAVLTVVQIFNIRVDPHEGE